jgi:anaerobic selenocysteine-containing dehydrogenase
MTTTISLLPAERDSVSQAIDLVRAAGWEEKAEALRKALADGKINVDLDMPLTHWAETNSYKGTVNFNPRVPLSKGSDPPKPLDRDSKDFIDLAATLLHEADHLLGHGEIEAYGEQLSFYEELNEHFEKYFPDTTGSNKESIEEWKKEVEKGYKRIRDRYIENPDWEKKGK